MPQFDIDTVLGWRGNTVRDRDGEKIGTVGDVFLDRHTDRPAWIGVKTGWFGSKQSYVSLASAQASAGELHVSSDKELVRTAPQIDPELSLTAEEEDALYRHYGVDYAAPAGDRAPDGAQPVPTADSASTSGARIAGDAPVTDATGAAPATESAGMVRSEEEIRLGHIERRPTERVRIKKVLVTDHVKQVVPVRREVVQLEHEPPPSGDIESSEELPSSAEPPRSGD